jgi:predicted ATPase
MSNYIESIRLKRTAVPNFDTYPFSIPAIASLNELSLHPKVTYLIGENGTGKSTLLEAIAVNFGFNPEGGTRNFHFSTYSSHSELSEYLTLVKGIHRPSDGFFFRAESFYNVSTEVERLSFKGLGRPIRESYGGNLHARSHGESFFALLQNRLSGKGLYLFDEPEAALSPTHQIAMLREMHRLIQADSQIILATHSPILMAYPDSILYHFSENGIEKVSYEQTEHYRLTRNFLNDYPHMLRELFRDL